MNKGFTVVEVIISLAILGIITTLSLNAFYSFKNRTSLSVATNTISQVMRRAILASEAMDGDSGWGVHIANGSIILFQGLSYGSRTVASDKAFDISGTSVSGLSDIAFSKLTGYPQQIGTTTIIGVDGSSKTIFINAKGGITY